MCKICFAPDEVIVNFSKIMTVPDKEDQIIVISCDYEHYYINKSRLKYLHNLKQMANAYSML